MTSVNQETSSDITSEIQKGKRNATKRSKGRPPRAGQRPMTPEATPDLDEARINADKNRIHEDVQPSTDNDGADFSTTKEPLADPDDDDESSADRVAEEVLKYGKDEYRKILGVDKKYDNPEVEDVALEQGLWDRAEMLHPKVNTTEDGAKAYQRILNAAHALKIDDETVREVMNWDGKGAEDEMETESGVPPPHPIIVGIYQKATPYFAQLLKDPTSKAATKALDDLNDEIKKVNGKDGVDPSDQWSIDYQDFVATYEEARPVMDRLQKDPNDEEAKNKVERYSNTLQHIITRKHYLPWNLDLDLAALKDLQAQQALKRSQAHVESPAPANLTTKLPGLTPVQKPANVESHPAASDSPQASAQEVPASSKPAQNIQLETLKLWAGMGWSTHKMSDGDIILSYKALSRLGQQPYAYEFTVMTQDSPYFQIKLGSEIGGQERDAYLALSKIHKINTDPGDPDTPRYSYRNKTNYEKLLWTASKPRKQTQAGRNPRAPDTQTCVVWKDGKVAEMSRAHFKTVTTENEMKAIENYCRSVDIKTPWEMDPKTLMVSANSTLGQQLLHAGRTGSAIDLNNPAAKAATSGAEISGAASSSLQASFAALRASMEAMESKFEKSRMSMQEQINKQLDLQTQMAKQISTQQEDQAKLQQQIQQQQVTMLESNQQILQMLSKLTPASA